MALGDGTAGVAGSALRGPALPWNRAKDLVRLSGIHRGGHGGRLRFDALVWRPRVDPDVALRICAATALVGAIVESTPDSPG